MQTMLKILTQSTNGAVLNNQRMRDKILKLVWFVEPVDARTYKKWISYRRFTTLLSPNRSNSNHVTFAANYSVALHYLCFTWTCRKLVVLVSLTFSFRRRRHTLILSWKIRKGLSRFCKLEASLPMRLPKRLQQKRKRRQEVLIAQKSA